MSNQKLVGNYSIMYNTATIYLCTTESCECVSQKFISESKMQIRTHTPTRDFKNDRYSIYSMFCIYFKIHTHTHTLMYHVSQQYVCRGWYHNFSFGISSSSCPKRTHMHSYIRINGSRYCILLPKNTYTHTHTCTMKYIIFWYIV